jgi:hypothetical protein
VVQYCHKRRSCVFAVNGTGRRRHGKQAPDYSARHPVSYCCPPVFLFNICLSLFVENYSFFSVDVLKQKFVLIEKIPVKFFCAKLRHPASNSEPLFFVCYKLLIFFSTSHGRLCDTVPILGNFENMKAQFQWLCGDIQVRIPVQ